MQNEINSGMIQGKRILQYNYMVPTAPLQRHNHAINFQDQECLDRMHKKLGPNVYVRVLETLYKVQWSEPKAKILLHQMRRQMDNPEIGSDHRQLIRKFASKYSVLDQQLVEEEQELRQREIQRIEESKMLYLKLGKRVHSQACDSNDVQDSPKHPKRPFHSDSADIQDPHPISTEKSQTHQITFMFKGFPKPWHTDMKEVSSKYPRTKHSDGANKFTYELTREEEQKARELLTKHGFKLENNGFYLTQSQIIAETIKQNLHKTQKSIVDKSSHIGVGSAVNSNADDKSGENNDDSQLELVEEDEQEECKSDIQVDAKDEYLTVSKMLFSRTLLQPVDQKIVQRLDAEVAQSECRFEDNLANKLQHMWAFQLREKQALKSKEKQSLN